MAGILGCDLYMLFVCDWLCHKSGKVYLILAKTLPGIYDPGAQFLGFTGGILGEGGVLVEGGVLQGLRESRLFSSALPLSFTHLYICVVYR